MDCFSIQIPSTIDKVLQTNLMCLLTGKSCQMSTYHDRSRFSANKAVDGIYTTTEAEKDTSLAHTRREQGPWWRVDLSTAYCIWAVRILNRACESASLVFVSIDVFYPWLKAS